MLAYVYGVVPISLCRSGGCGVSAGNGKGVRIEFDDENDINVGGTNAAIGKKVQHFIFCKCRALQLVSGFDSFVHETFLCRKSSMQITVMQVISHLFISMACNRKVSWDEGYSVSMLVQWCRFGPGVKQPSFYHTFFFKCFYAVGPPYYNILQ